jgi:capsular polysaccharide biosynthesis protein
MIVGSCAVVLISPSALAPITVGFIANLAIYILIIHFSLFLLVREVKSRPDIGSNREKIKISVYSIVLFATCYLSIRFLLSWAGVA